MSNVVIGSNPVPGDVQVEIAHLVNVIGRRYDFKQGETALFWALSYMISQHLGEPLP